MNRWNRQEIEELVEHTKNVKNYFSQLMAINTPTDDPIAKWEGDIIEHWAKQELKEWERMVERIQKKAAV